MNVHPQRVDQQSSVFNYRFNFGSIVVAILLFVTLLALFERVLYDVARVFVNPNPSYFNSIGVIISHAIVIVVLLFVSVILNTKLGMRKQKYAIAVIPYFVVSAALTLQLASQVFWYFSNHHTDLEFYVVTIVLIAALSYAIYVLQSKFRPTKTEFGSER
jgi:hypothetical protein